MGLLEGKVGLIYGVRNERSIGWGCAKSISREGGRMVLAVFSEREQKDVEKLVPTLPDPDSVIIKPCDLTKSDQVDALHAAVAAAFGRLDFMIYAVAFAKREDIGGRYADTTQDGFHVAMDASVYSFVAATRAAEPLMEAGGSVVTMSYLGSERVIPNYNVMGVAKAALESSVRYLANDLGPKNIRVNSISAGPTMTLAARGISGFADMYKEVPARAPLRRNTTIEEVGDATAFMVSDWARCITGEVIFVDNGMHTLA